MSFFPTEHSWGLLFGELLSARLFGTVLPINGERALDAELMRFIPDEIVIPSDAGPFRSFFSHRGYCTSVVDTQTEQPAMDQWMANFLPEVRKNLDSNYALNRALYHFYLYVRKNQEAALAQFNSLQIYKPEEFLVLDSATVRNLELIKNAYDGGREHTLFEVLDGAATSMGSRTIKNWLICPRVDKAVIEQRYDAIDAIMGDIAVMQQLRELFAFFLFVMFVAHAEVFLEGRLAPPSRLSPLTPAASGSRGALRNAWSTSR